MASSGGLFFLDSENMGLTVAVFGAFIAFVTIILIIFCLAKRLFFLIFL